ncbi:TlpA disulfide reductase family protein [Sediminibacterium sp.]|uniref:TlpA family protein disulfide reductase n=1 Tax=Sediminibacterium sp. TaxID=1917865 RepID=UPI00272FA0C9|nr:TlpA disulfide reductase family protein [Sediminibacterium sp.]MDP2422148.1 TlpA disulfide reductase family protein [Sediminibacterium sp.]
MRIIFFISLLLTCWTQIYSQTVVKGKIKNYRNQTLIISTSKYDSVQQVSTDSKGYFSIDLHQLSPFEGNLLLGKKKIIFFSSPLDTVTITADFRNIEKSLFISNQKSRTASTSKLKILEVETIDSLAALISYTDNQVTLVEVWATWCGPCIAQQKIIKKYKSKYKSLGVNFFYISMDGQDSKEKWERFINYTNLEGTHVLANKILFNEISKKYGAIPVYFIIDKEKRIHRFVASETKIIGNMLAIFDKEIAELFSTLNQYLK